MIEISSRRLSSIFPVHSSTYQNTNHKSRGAVTPPGVRSAPPFFPPGIACVNLSTTKRQTSTTPKMDMFVSSPFVASPHSSIYDPDRPDQGTLCDNSTPFSNPSVDSVVSDDICLDDKLEDSTLQNFLTPDVMNTLQTMNPSDLSWPGKLETDSMPGPLTSLDSNPTLAQLNMGPELSFVNDMLNLDQSDKRFSYTGLDFLCNDLSSDVSSPSNFTSLSDAVPNFGLSSSDVKEPCFDQQKSLNEAGNNYIRSAAPVKNNFPPRASQPPLIGIVTPVKKATQEPEIATEKLNDGLGKLKAQSPNLHKLLSTHPVKQEDVLKPSCPVKTELEFSPGPQTGKVYTNLGQPCDMTTQIVPFSGGIKRSNNGVIKTEPTSPGSLRRPLLKEESTEDKWKDIENFIHNPAQEPSVKKRRRYDSGSSSHISDDEDDDDDDSYSNEKDRDDDSDDDYSDIDADLTNISPSECESLVATGKKQKQYFWQYNVQSKGPKGTRLKLSVESPADPHVLNDFEDPVFDECNTSIAGIRHGGKARKGDGNEITPNPRKLFMIGHQLMRLNRQISACQLGSDVPAAKRNESRKEKNKLASRACRLKKKAQHEANKIKLYGLEQEHGQMNKVLKTIWPNLRERAKALLGRTDKTEVSSSPASLTSTLESLISQNIKGVIAGHTTDYVNSVILKVEAGDMAGGLNIRRSQKT